MKTEFRFRTKAFCLVAILLATCLPPLSAQETDTATAEKTEPAALAIGDAAPDFTVQTFDEKSVTLSDHFGDEGQPVILLFSRANW